MMESQPPIMCDSQHRRSCEKDTFLKDVEGGLQHRCPTIEAIQDDYDDKLQNSTSHLKFKGSINDEKYE